MTPEAPPTASMKLKTLTLIDPAETDAQGNTRPFSINSAPDDPELIFTTRLRDTAFKRSLGTLPLGTAVKGDGPFGDFVLHNNPKRPAVLLAGGIGVTPFRSIARRAAHERLPHRILLFYANRRPEDAPFLDEFRGLARENANFIFVPTMTQASRPAWDGDSGHIDDALLAKYLGKDRQAGAGLVPLYYIAGPPGMVAGLRAMLSQTMARGTDRQIAL